MKINGNCFRGIIMNVLLWMPFSHIAEASPRVFPAHIYPDVDTLARVGVGFSRVDMGKDELLSCFKLTSELSL